jgi:hypothetical protein
MQLLRRALAPWRARRAAQAEYEIRSWYDACQVVLQACAKALQDPELPRGDIGVTLDRIDRSLFRLRDTRSGARQALRRRDSELGARVGRVSEAIVELRNDTARFLIHAQGPTPSFLQKDDATSAQPGAHRQALHDTGRGALARSLTIERDLRHLWDDLQPVLAQLASSAAGK